MSRRRRQDKAELLIEGGGKLIIMGAFLLALVVGGMRGWGAIFNSLMDWLLVIVLVVVVGGGIALWLLAPRISSVLAPKPQGASDPAPPGPSLAQQIRDQDWLQFEKAIGAVLLAQGFAVERRGGANADGGIDLVAKNGEDVMAVQCKHWKTWNVNVKTVREFLGAMTHAKIGWGVIVTLNGYTHDAEELAKAHNIELIDETELVALIQAHGIEHAPGLQQALCDKTKYCPKCEAPMVQRQGYNEFW